MKISIDQAGIWRRLAIACAIAAALIAGRAACADDDPDGAIHKGDMVRLSGKRYWALEVTRCTSLLPGNNLFRAEDEQRMGSIPASPGLLYLSDHGKIARIDRLSQLRGHVAIKTPAQALEYVRLATYPAWYWAHMLKPKIEAVEVMNFSDFSKLDNGHQREDEVLEGLPGLGGVVSDDLFAALHLPEARCRQVGNDFIVQRRLMLNPYVLFGNNWQGREDVVFYDVVEYVHADGAYELKSKTSAIIHLFWWFRHAE